MAAGEWKPLYILTFCYTEKLLSKKAGVIFVIAATVALTGCQNMTETQRNTMIGTGIGAVAGAGVAKATGHKAGKGALIGAAIGGIGTYVWSANMERQRKELEAATRGTGVTVSRTTDNQLKLAIPADISFDSNKAVIKPAFRPVLNQFANSLQRNPHTHVVIIGHTDSTGSDRINDPLSLNRANATRDYIFAQGVRGPRIQTQGRGSREPIASNDSAWGRGKNRRVEVYIAQAQ